MRKFFALFLFSAVVLAADSPPITRWIDPLGGKPITPQEYESQVDFPSAPLILGEVKSTGGFAAQITPLIDIVVNAAIFPYIEPEIDRFADDIAADGYSVRVDTMRSGTADDLRDHLASLLPEIDGAIFVGTLPVKWYRMEETLYVPDTFIYTVEIFPCDYYFSDLDGIWADTNSDGILDHHDRTYDPEPEIYVARIDPARLSYDDPISLLKRYFDKNHAYRVGEMPVMPWVLSYEYKDWWDFFSYGFSEFDYADIERDSALFSAPDYLMRLRDYPFELVNIMCHSSPWRHYMDPTLTFNNDLAVIPPNALFYHLFACSGARFVEMDNLGNVYLFMGPRALWVVGSSKTGSIIPGLTLSTFFHQLRYNTVGEDLRSILSDYGEEYPLWHYGLVILGDPTLRVSYDYIGDSYAPESLVSEPEGNLLDTPGQATDVEISVDSAGIYVFVLHGGDSWFRNVEKFFYDGAFVYDSGAAEYYGVGSGQLVITKNSSTPFIATEGDPLQIGVLGVSYREWDIDRGEGYESYPYLISSDSGAALLYVNRVGSYGEVNSILHLSIFHDNTWDFDPEYNFGIASSSAEKFFPCGVVDSAGRFRIFWAEADSDNYFILAALLDTALGILYPVDTVAVGIQPAGVVDSRGRVWLFWRDLLGNLLAMTLEDSSWSVPETIWNAGSAFDIRAVLDNDGSPTVMFAAWTDSLNTDIYAARLGEDGWIVSRLTYSPTPDFAPDGVFLPDGRLLAVWIGGNTRDLAAYWNLFDLSGVDEFYGILPLHLKVSVSPNPFNSALRIRWNDGSRRRVEVFDVAGKLVDVLHGKGQVVWHPDEAPAGVYFVLVEGARVPVKTIYLK